MRPENNLQDSIELIIVEPKININHEDLNCKMAIQLNSKIDTPFILYNFKKVEPALLTEEDYINGECTAGIALFILKDNLPVPAFTSIPDNIYGQSITKDTLFTVLSRLSDAFIDNGVILRGVQNLKLSLVVDFAGYQLYPGEYRLFLIYYTGKNIGNIVSPKKQDYYSRKNDVNVFHGWLKSNTVQLVVE